jgi:AcrR family transcriptional regulator
MSTSSDGLLARAFGSLGSDKVEASGTARKILDAALEQFELVGIARTTVDDITRRARVARVTVYRHFGAKEAIVEAVILRELALFHTDLDVELARHDRPEDKLSEGFVFTVDRIRGNVLLQRMLQTEPETLLPYLTTEGRAFVETGALFLAHHLAVSAQDPRDMSELLVAAEVASRLIVSLVLTPSNNIDLDDPDSVRLFARRYIAPLLSSSD